MVVEVVYTAVALGTVLGALQTVGLAQVAEMKLPDDYQMKW